MAYFSHAFKKTFVMSDYVSPDPAAPTALTQELPKGTVSLYNGSTWTPSDLGNECCQFILAQGAPYQKDKVGPFHGGYQETLKSKGINPKYVTKIWTSDASDAQQAILHVGTTPYTVGNDGCCPEFLCGENYHLRIDLKGSPALRMLNHNSYQEITAYGGCCPDDDVDPSAVDPALIMIQWAEGVQESVILQGGDHNDTPFVIPVVSVATAADVALGHITALYYPPTVDIAAVGFVAAAQGAVQAVTGQGAGPTIDTWDNYASAFAAGDCAGLTLVGAYVETKFGDCTFQPSDFYGLEPIRIYASEVDLNGDPCAFTGICIETECEGKQAQGLGETAARDYILSESYRQNPYATDLRIREITQGTDLLGGGAGQIDRTASYDRTMILHNVPRFNNPTGVFDNDQYLIEVLTPSTVDGKADRTQLLIDLSKILDACVGDTRCVELPAGTTVDCPDPSIVVSV